MNRFSSDVDIMDNKLPESFRLWSVMVFSTLAVVIVVGITTPIFIAAIIPVAILFAFAVVCYLASFKLFVSCMQLTSYLTILPHLPWQKNGRRRDKWTDFFNILCHLELQGQWAGLFWRQNRPEFTTWLSPQDWVFTRFLFYKILKSKSHDILREWRRR
jgi:hypothetical protein